MIISIDAYLVLFDRHPLGFSHCYSIGLFTFHRSSEAFLRMEVQTFITLFDFSFIGLFAFVLKTCFSIVKEYYG